MRARPIGVEGGAGGRCREGGAGSCSLRREGWPPALRGGGGVSPPAGLEPQGPVTSLCPSRGSPSSSPLNQTRRLLKASPRRAWSPSAGRPQRGLGPSCLTRSPQRVPGLRLNHGLDGGAWASRPPFHNPAVLPRLLGPGAILQGSPCNRGSCQAGVSA